MKHKPTTSLIITTYNRPDALELTLLSLLDQAELPEEIIIADDGSLEDTKALICKYANKFPIPLTHCWQKDKGFRLSRIRNIAIASSNFDYIVLIDGDIILDRRFIMNHRQAADTGFFVQGNRARLSEKISKKLILNKCPKIDLFALFGNAIISDRLSSIYSPFLSRLMHWLAKGPSDALRMVRGCNLAFWRDDALKINGFNEDLVGWGREDNEFISRLINNGVKRKNLKFAGIAYHLYHKNNHQEDSLHRNSLILSEVIKNKKTYCANGLDKYLLTDRIACKP